MRQKGKVTNWNDDKGFGFITPVAGGWPGALMAQQKLRHKSKKQSFRAVFWVTVLVNFSAFIWLLTPNGNTIFQSLVVHIT